VGRRPERLKQTWDALYLSRLANFLTNRLPLIVLVLLDGIKEGLALET
jgi:hypothetical protein